MILLIRIADTIDAFEEDAKLMARLFSLPLLTQDGSLMVTFHVSELEPYLRALLDGGHRVAVCQEVRPERLTAPLEVDDLASSATNGEQP